MLLCTVAILTGEETNLEGINVLEIIFLQEVFFLIFASRSLRLFLRRGFTPRQFLNYL